MSERTGWDRGLVVGADGKGLVGHAGVVLLRRLADRSGLTEALAGVFPAGGPGWRDRAVVFVQLAISIALGARSVAEAEQLALHHERMTGPGVPDSTKKTGFKYSVIATNINKMTRIPGSHQAQWLDALHRHHAVVEDRARTNKAMGPHNLPSKSFTANQGWTLAANLRRRPRRRPRRLAPPPGPARPGRARRRRTRHHAVPDPPPARPPHHPRPPPAPPPRPRPAPGSRLRPGTAAPDRRHLTTRPRPDEDQEGETRTTPGPWNPAQPQRHAKTLTANSGNKQGEMTTLSGNDHP